MRATRALPPTMRSAPASVIGLELFKIIDFLKNNRDDVSLKALSAEEIKEMIDVDIVGNPGLLAAIRNNPKISVRAIGNADPLTAAPQHLRFAFKPTHEVANAKELLALLKNNRFGIDRTELLESYKGIETDIEDLEENDEVFIIENKENNRVIIFPHTSPPIMDVGEDILKLWRDAKMPQSDAEFEQQLVEWGVVTKEEMDRGKPKHKPPQKHKAAPKTKRRPITKLTNVHLKAEGIDFSKAYMPDQQNQ